jgi:hypothetical protein
MIENNRVSIFEEEIDLSGFAPEVEPIPAAPPAELVRRVSESAHFHSREPARAQSQAKHKPRTYRTGRTATFSAKTTPVVYDALYAIAESQEWKIGETLEHALAALQRELSIQG